MGNLGGCVRRSTANRAATDKGAVSWVKPDRFLTVAALKEPPYTRTGVLPACPPVTEAIG